MIDNNGVCQCPDCNSPVIDRIPPDPEDYNPDIDEEEAEETDHQ